MENKNEVGTIEFEEIVLTQNGRRYSISNGNWREIPHTTNEKCPYCDWNLVLTTWYGPSYDCWNGKCPSNDKNGDIYKERQKQIKENMEYIKNLPSCPGLRTLTIPEDVYKKMQEQYTVTAIPINITNTTTNGQC